MSIHPGDTIGRYRIEAHVGSGGFGDVFRAHDDTLKRSVAIKSLKETGRDDVDKALREARAASSLNHPSIVTVHDVGQHEGSAFIVMEWIDGSTLRETFAGRSVELERVGDIATQIASALAAAHDAGIVHRDLKPENVIVRPDGVVKLLDFGVAHMRSSESFSGGETVTHGVVGTLAYMAPEQLEDRPVDGACDAFALGIILYQLLTGRHPFAAASPHATMQRILNFEPPPPSSAGALPTGWDDMVLQLLAKDPKARATESDLLDLLRSSATHARRRQEVADLTPIVGRTAELATLHARWDQACAGQGSCFTVSAEPGAGKTTLTQRFLKEITSDAAALVATGRCSERLGSGEAYLPFLEALTELGNSSRGGLVRAVLKSKAPTWFIQLFPAFSSDASFEQLRRELAGGSQERMRRELADALAEMSRSYSVCLALEDLHWSDLATTELISYLSNRLGDMRVLLIGTYRPAELMASDHPLRPILLDMQARGAAIELALGFLRESDIRSYIDLEFAGHVFPLELSAWIARKTEGNPLFMVDLLRFLVERHVLVKGARWELVRPLESLEGDVPASVSALIERNFQMLSEEQRRWLTVAAVQGESFDSLTLSEVAEIDELRLEDQLETLHRVHRLIQPLGERECPDGSVTVDHRFVHVLYQETLYGGLTAKRKMLLHDRVGRHLERRHGSGASTVAAELALHFDRARKSREAVSYYVGAAQNATSRFAHVQAVAYCDRALELTEGLPVDERDRQRMAIHKMRGTVCYVMSRFQEAVADFEAMLTAAQHLGNPDAEAHALCLLADGTFFLKEADKLERYVARAVRIAEQHDLPHRACHARLILGLQRQCHGKLDESGELLTTAAKEAEAMNLGDIRARSLLWCIQHWFFRSDYERVLARTRQTEALSIENHDGYSLVANYFFTGLTEANVGKLGNGMRTLRLGVSTAERNNDLFWLGRFPNCVGWVHHEALDFERALAVNREAVSIARQTGFLEGEANSQVNVGLAAIELGDVQLARESFLQAEDVFVRDDWYKWRYRLRLENGWADLYMCVGDLGEARTHAARCWKSAKETGSRKHLAMAHRQLGRIALLEDRVAEAEKHLTTAVGLTRDLQAPLAAWRCYLSLADLYAATHREEETTVSRATARQILRGIADNGDDDTKASIVRSKTLRDLDTLLGK